jgi:hypothetical protein
MTAALLKPLTEAERARVAHTVSQVKELMPELVSVVKDLHAAGLIDGWRDVAYVGPIRPEPSGPKVFTADRMVLESAAATRERMSRGTH